MTTTVVYAGSLGANSLIQSDLTMTLTLADGADTLEQKMLVEWSYIDGSEITISDNWSGISAFCIELADTLDKPY